MLSSLDTDFDAIYFGTCVKKATAMMSCPKNVEGISAKLEEIYGVPVIMGTHEY